MSAGVTPRRSLSRALPGATVLQILPALVNNYAARAVVNVAWLLLRSGARAMVASAGGRLVGELQALGGEWVQLPTATFNPFTLRSNSGKLAELIARERVDIVHAYSGPIAWSARAAVRDTGALMVTTYSGAPLPRTDPGWVYQRALARGARVLVDSGYAAGLVRRRHDIAAERIVVIPHAVDTMRFDPAVISAERLALLRHGWRIRPGTRVVFVPGRLRRARGQLTLVDAARILVNGGLRGVAFVIAGEDPPEPDYARAVRERIEAQGLAALIRRIGHCSDMPAAYAVGDMTVVPASEPMTSDPIVLEAQAMARPVVATNIGVMPESVPAPPFFPEEERTGWLVPPDDPVALARAIAAALALDARAAREVGERARLFADQFSPARVAAGTLAVYTSLLEGDERQS